MPNDIGLFGRTMILSGEEAITDGNVVEVVSDAYMKHLVNRNQIEYLYNYYKGKQPILARKKEVRPEICNHVVENRANAIVTFRVGYTVGKPVQYISSVSDDKVSQDIATLNDLMRVAGKASKDKQLVEWQMICGTGYRLVLPNERRNPKVPFELYTVDPRDAFVIYKNDIGKTPLAGVYYTTDEEQNITFHIYTEGHYYEVFGWQEGILVKSEGLRLPSIPIIEYPLNTARLGSFEVCLPLLDELNNLESNRIDSVEQFVQSLLVATNCDFGEDVTANQIREAGMVVLRSIGENKADIKVISETLNQDQTQTLKESILQAIYEIAGIPVQGNGKSNDSSNNVAVVLKNGWQGAETRAQDFEQEFKGPEQRTLELVTDICRMLSDLDLDPNNIEPKFTRRNYEDLLVKSQTLVTMLTQNKIHPQCAYEASGLFLDTQEAYNMGMDWYEKETERARQEEEARLERERLAKELEQGREQPKETAEDNAQGA